VQEFDTFTIAIFAIVLILQVVFFLRTIIEIRKLSNFDEYKLSDKLRYDFNYAENSMENRISFLENNVQVYINIPLYLGLLGTITGIVLGLLNMDIVNTGEIDVDYLVKKVAIAMLVSGVGILITFFNSCYFAYARNSGEEYKENFLINLKLELRDTEKYKENEIFQETINRLIINLNAFNSDFKNNNENFGKFISGFSNTLEQEMKVIEESKKSVLELMKSQDFVTFRLKESAEQMRSSAEKIAELNLQDFGDIVDKLLETTKNSLNAARGVILQQGSELKDALEILNRKINEYIIKSKDDFTGSLLKSKDTMEESLENIEKHFLDDTKELSKKLNNIAIKNREDAEEFLKNINTKFDLKELELFTEAGKILNEFKENSKLLENQIDGKIKSVDEKIELANKGIKNIDEKIESVRYNTQKIIDKPSFFRRFFKK